MFLTTPKKPSINYPAKPSNSVLKPWQPSRKMAVSFGISLFLLFSTQLMVIPSPSSHPFCSLLPSSHVPLHPCFLPSTLPKRERERFSTCVNIVPLPSIPLLLLLCSHLEKDILPFTSIWALTTHTLKHNFTNTNTLILTSTHTYRLHLKCIYS